MTRSLRGRLALSYIDGFLQHGRGLFRMALLQRQIGDLQGHVMIARVLASSPQQQGLGLVEPPGVHQSPRHREIHISLAHLEVLAAKSLLVLRQLTAQDFGFAQDRRHAFGIDACLEAQEGQLHPLAHQIGDLVCAGVLPFQHGQRLVEVAQGQKGCRYKAGHARSEQQHLAVAGEKDEPTAQDLGRSHRIDPIAGGAEQQLTAGKKATASAKVSAGWAPERLTAARSLRKSGSSPGLSTKRAAVSAARLICPQRRYSALALMAMAESDSLSSNNSLSMLRPPTPVPGGRRNMRVSRCWRSEASRATRSTTAGLGQVAATPSRMSAAVG